MGKILIKGLEMPKEVNHPLFIRISSDGHIAKGDFLKDGFIETEATAIELPPHGELKDATEMLKDFKHWFCKDCNNYNKIRCRSCNISDIIDYIEGSRTIVEANT